MKHFIYLFLIFLVFTGCSIQPKVESLPGWENENYDDALVLFKNNCKIPKVQQIYGSLCEDALYAEDAKSFFENSFELKEIKSVKEGLLTGYYEPQLRGSLTKKEPYIYPIYEKPNDLVVVKLDSIYPELKNYRLRGRVEDGKLLPYYTRKQSKERGLDANIICYVDSKIDRFFLEVQGSGRISLDNGEDIFVGYSNQNGYKYSSIGKYLIKIGEIKKEDISLQTIREWFERNPKRVDEVLNYNKSMVYFEKREGGATGSLGVVLTPKRSVAVDRRYIDLGTFLYADSIVDLKKFNSIVVAQDTGGAIKGNLRADLFLGYGDEAMRVAGKLKSPLRLWVLLPKKGINE
jgi:membrane-bound lytic murein transglycosylase A